jgi:cell division protein FtsZ
MPGLINRDFADVRTTVLDGGAAIMGSATAEGPERAEIAAREAINSPLLDGVSIRGARNVLVNISAGGSLGMRETTTATSIIQQEAGDDAEIILGTVLDESFEDQIRVTVIATGFDLADDRNTPKVAPNAQSQRKASIQVNTNMPKASEIPSRFTRTASDFYKGEGNLKKLDAPAIHRRELRVRKMEEEAAENQMPEDTSIEKKATGTGNLPNNREERIDKSDSEQPAFLRKIMD